MAEKLIPGVLFFFYGRVFARPAFNRNIFHTLSQDKSVTTSRMDNSQSPLNAKNASGVSFLKTLPAPESLLTVSLCLLGIALGLNRHIHAMMRVSGILGLILLWPWLRSLRWQKDVYGLVAAALFALFVFLTPGSWLADYRMGWKIFATLLASAAAATLSRNPFPMFMRCLVLTLALCFAWHLLVDPAWGVTNEGQLKLRSSPNELGILSAWCALYFIYEGASGTPRKRSQDLAAVVVCILLMWLSACRTSQLAFAVAFLFLLYRRFSWKTRIAAILIIAACTAGGFALLPERQQERVLSAVATAQQDPTFLSRQPIWEAAVHGFTKAPLLGHGIQNFTAYHRDYVQKNRSSLRQKYPIIEPSAKHTHNVYLALLFGFGIGGTVLFAAAVLPAAKQAWQSRDDFCLSVLILTAVSGFLESPIQRTDGILMLFLPLGMVYGRQIAARFHLGPFAAPSPAAAPSPLSKNA